MPQKMVIAGALVLLAALALVQTAVAKGPPDKVVITGPGLAAPLEITQPAQLQDFSIYAFENVNDRIPAPKNPGVGYVITRYIHRDSPPVAGDLIAWDRLVYYPPATGAGGYVFYEGLQQPGMSSEFDGHWYAASPMADAVMRRLPPALPATGAPAAGPGGLVLLAGVALGGGLLLLAGLAMVGRARQRGL